MGKTKKVKTAGRLGSRYGVGIRKRLLKIESKQQKKYVCPFCGFKKVRRTAPGLYVCRKCSAKFAGGAYFPVTLPGSIIKKTVSQKSFVSKGPGLEKFIEEAVEESEETPEEHAGAREKALKGPAEGDGKTEKKHAKKKYAKEGE